jgi:long-subunit acyl-CoA synthetase (AMP-forming)
MDNMKSAGLGGFLFRERDDMETAMNSSKTDIITLEQAGSLAGAFAGPWGIGNGLMTPTMKLCRAKIISRYQSSINSLYAGH